MTVGAETQNTTVSLLRGETTDDFGDVTDSPTAVAQGVGATLIETAQVVQDPSTQTPRVIRTTTALVPLWLGAGENDRLLDETSGDVFMVEDVVKIPNLTGAVPDLKLVLRRVTQ